VVAFEALARSNEPALPHPGALFDAAHQLDRLAELSRTTRCLSAGLFAQRRERVFVNLHPNDLLDESLFDRKAPLSRLAPRVVLEITERASLGRIADLRERVVRLRNLGYRIAIDDLGAGYSGLSAFCALQPDTAKIDMSLIRDVDRLPTKQRLVRSLVDACGDLDIELVAEGVETEAELRTLVELGCELFQGFLFARPSSTPPTVHWPGGR
jgi:EAL domain-containing protein (putative c-di-GMP-specific phosphodiesterase class I)